MAQTLDEYLSQEIETLKSEGLFKPERVIVSPQAGEIAVNSGAQVLNFCANNYLGLANNESLVEAGKAAMDHYKAGMASVRFICGTLDIHKTLEKRMAAFTGKQDVILYTSCFDANTGLFETLLDQSDAIISDELNHASIIDGVRLCKAQRFRYKNNDMQDLERYLKESGSARFRMIVTDGVFSMDGTIADLPAICELAEKYNALVVVDESHAVGFMGDRGTGSVDFHNVTERVDIVTGTFGKALGGSSGGYTAASKPVVEWLRQRSRPYLFSNTLAPVIAGIALAALDILEKEGPALRKKLQENSVYFREKMTAAGFDLLPGKHPIIPVMLYDAALAAKFAEEMLKRGVYVISFSYPVVPKGKARIRTQMSAAHSREDIDRAICAFAEVGKQLGVLKSAA